MDMGPIILAIPVFFGLIVIELLFQHWKKDNHYRLSDAITNISCGIIQQLSGFFLTIVSVGVYVFIYEYLRIWTISNNWWTFLILFILVDVCYYWAHRKSHEVSLFWGGHVVHHQSEDYNLSVALRQSSFQIFFTFFFYFPLAVIGFDPKYFVLANAFGTLYQFWIHTESIDKMGWFEILFNTPSHHRVHHGKNPKYIDKNHAGVFIIWDKLFGTFQEEEERPTYGITIPINSWDPIWANFAHFKSLAKILVKVKSPLDGLKVLFNKPGWMPDYMGGPILPSKIDRASYKKYNLPLSLHLSIYALIQYLFILAYTAFFMMQFKGFNSHVQMAGSLFLLFSIWSCSKLLQDKKWAFKIDAIRCFTSICIAYWFMELIIITSLAFYIVLAILLSSLLYLIILIRTNGT